MFNLNCSPHPMHLDNVILPILLFFNITVVITFPLHIIFVFVLIRRRKSAELGSPFHHLLLNIGVSDLINATGYLFFQEPAWLGISGEFFLQNAWFIAKIVNICGITVSNVPLVIHFFLALNRFTAIRLPIKHLTIWHKPTVLRISFVVWVTAGCLSIPMIYPVEFRGYIFSNGHLSSVAFQFVSARASTFYTAYVLILSTFIVPTIAIYVYLVIYICSKKKTKNQVQEVVVKSTVAVFLTSLGDIVLAAVIGSQQLYWMLYSEDLMPIKIYWLLFKVGHDLHNIATPWVMVLLFARIRRDIRYVLIGSTRTTQSASSV